MPIDICVGIPNNGAMTDAEIIELLGGPTAVARMLGIKPPSVCGWLVEGIPDGRLRDLAGQIELRSNGRFTRRARWPDKFSFYWPELAPPGSGPIPTVIASAPAATSEVGAPSATLGA